MTVVNQATLLLLLAVLGTKAAPGPEDCGGLNVTLPPKDLDKVFGTWVLVWSVSDNLEATELLENLTSSVIELRLLPDNTTIVYNERNMFQDKSCTKYFINMSMPSDSDSAAPLRSVGGSFHKDGVLSEFNDPGRVEFFVSCSDCLMMVYRGDIGNFLLSYRREGQHQDVEQLKASHSDNKKLAECLRFPHDKPFIYDGAAEFCPEKEAEKLENP
ncbi:saxitoxin and tetrodotoxin-binding protein 1 isoform X2 [Dicentrarchus labrax]|uniref:saxitoxin and tetrodotoxin-binding protein 1 isoform X1 n=1 Tax=Dicentrarchus labrax TaxID=13489 RepID=UPI0016347356|nr:saxitoxin and tetrodotoxin-binding protein 1 isoform X1 [Dicentrarchus labrax]XP_051246943.1 saxitoxin and tetrodotoxin-binding protein 1 isoform X2 [Dicentrarchus labrax]